MVTDDDIDKMLAYVVALEAENQELRAELAEANTKAPYTYPDGSTSRMVLRVNCQEIAEEVITYWLEDDSLGALQAWDRCRNEAEKGHINRWLNTKQRSWLREAESSLSRVYHLHAERSSNAGEGDGGISHESASVDADVVAVIE